MKRSAMRRTRRKPRPGKNATLYRDYDVSRSELAMYLNVTIRLIRGKFVFETVMPGQEVRGGERHHIWGGNGRRYDVQSNLCGLNWVEHKCFTDKMPNQGLTLCCLAKARKARALGDPSEFSLAEIDAVAGKSTLATIAGYDFEGDSLMRAWQFECVQVLAETAAH